MVLRYAAAECRSICSDGCVGDAHVPHPLCTGVLIPSNRIAPVTANALASLNALAPHRIICGLSTGFTARRTMGLRAVKLARVEEYVRVLRGLLAKETVEWALEDFCPHRRSQRQTRNPKSQIELF